MGMFSDPSRTTDYVHILLLHLLNHFAMFTLPVVILFLRDDFAINYTGAGVLWTALIVTNTIVSIFVGFYADTYRNRRYPIIYLGITIMLIGWFLIPLAATFTHLIYIFIFIGFGAAGFHPTAFTLITEMFEESKGRALSYNMAIGLFGNAVAPLLFAGLVSSSGNYINAIVVTSAIFVASVIILFIIAKRAKTFGRTDWRPEEEQHIQSGNSDIWFLLSPLILVPLFYTSIRNSFFKTSSLFTALLYEDFLMLSKTEASIATAGVLGFASIFLIIGGQITDRTLPRVAIIISSVGTLAAAFGLVYLNDFSDLFVFSGFYFALNAFYYIGSPAASALLADRVRPEQRGKLYGALFSFGQVLSLGTPVAFGYIKDLHGIRAAFQFILVLAGIAFITGLYIFIEERRRLPNEKTEIETPQLIQ